MKERGHRPVENPKDRHVVVAAAGKAERPNQRALLPRTQDMDVRPGKLPLPPRLWRGSISAHLPAANLQKGWKILNPPEAEHHAPEIACGIQAALA